MLNADRQRLRRAVRWAETQYGLAQSAARVRSAGGGSIGILATFQSYGTGQTVNVRIAGSATDTVARGLLWDGVTQDMVTELDNPDVWPPLTNGAEVVITRAGDEYLVIVPRFDLTHALEI